MSTIHDITTLLKKWESEYKESRTDYNDFIMEYEDSHPFFHKKLVEAWDETNGIFEMIDKDYQKEKDAAKQKNEPQRTIDLALAKRKRNKERQKAYDDYKEIREELMDEALKDESVEMLERFEELKSNFKKAKKTKDKLEKKLVEFLNSKAFRDKILK